MKTILILLVAALTANSPVWAQTEQYKQAMSAALGSMKTQSANTSLVKFLTVANQFKRIAGAEPNEWLPRYYAGLMYVYLGFMGKTETKKDKFLDQADANLKAAEATVASANRPDNDELAVLSAYIAQARMTVDPMNRWQQYGPQVQAGITKAKSLNINNPRAYVLEGSGLMFTPEQFGGGPAVACPVLKQAIEKFATFKPVSDLHPMWGQKQIEPMLEKCPK